MKLGVGIDKQMQLGMVRKLGESPCFGIQTLWIKPPKVKVFGGA